MEWYKNQKVGIFFDKNPIIRIRYITPNTAPEDKISIKKYPFINKRVLFVTIDDYRKSKEYNFTIPKGYCFDGASIPKFFWRIVGSNTDNSFLVPALIHDTLCENHSYVDNDKNLSSEVFNALLEANSVFFLKRFLMKHSVNFYQNFCKWG